MSMLSRYIIVVDTSDQKKYDNTIQSIKSFSVKVGNPRKIKSVVIADIESHNLPKIREIEGILSIDRDSEQTPDEVSTRPSKGWLLEDVSESEDGVYEYTRTGKGVDLYVIDSGVRDTHQDFDGRVTTLHSIHPEGHPYDDDSSLWDTLNRSHGTMCMSLAGGSIYGIASEANLFNMFSGFQWSESIKCLDIIADRHVNGTNPSIVSMSFSRGEDTKRVYEQVVKELDSLGVIMFGSAGNENNDVAQHPRYPSSYPQVVSVGAMTTNDDVASYSNYGVGVDLFAPAHGGTCAGIYGDEWEQYTSGTSAACPLAAGVCALLLEDSRKPENSEETSQVRNMFFNYCTKEYQPKREHVFGGPINNPKKRLTSRFKLSGPVLEEKEPVAPEPTPEPTPAPEPTPKPAPEPEPNKKKKLKWYEKVWEWLKSLF